MNGDPAAPRGAAAAGRAGGGGGHRHHHRHHQQPHPTHHNPLRPQTAMVAPMIDPFGAFGGGGLFGGGLFVRIDCYWFNFSKFHFKRRYWCDLHMAFYRVNLINSLKNSERRTLFWFGASNVIYWTSSTIVYLMTLDAPSQNKVRPSKFRGLLIKKLLEWSIFLNIRAEAACLAAAVCSPLRWRRRRWRRWAAWTPSTWEGACPSPAWAPSAVREARPWAACQVGCCAYWLTEHFLSS